MKNHIKVVSRHKFKSIVLPMGSIPNELAVISIHEPKNKILFGSGYAEQYPIILEDAPNVLNLWFNDEETYNPETESVLFDESMADAVIKFVEANKDAEAWLVHCTMGKARSGAIGSYLADYFGIDWFDFKRDNPQVQPNSLVRKLLTRRLLEK